MKPLKTREPAKKRLLAAFGGADGKSVEAPKAVLELEVALRKEWKELDAKAAASDGGEEGVDQN